MADNEQHEKPKKPKKQRTPKAAAPKAAAPKKQPEEHEEPKPKYRVERDGKRITLAGKDVKLAVMTPEQLKKFGILSIEGGTVGQPCHDVEQVLTFKSPAAAKNFFDQNLHPEDDEEEFIISGGKTEWYAEDVMSRFVS